MSSWLRWLFGLEEGEIPAGSEFQWELSGLPEGGMLFVWTIVVALCVALVVLLYRAERTLSRVQKVTLASLRLVALGLLILVLVNPRLLSEIQSTRPGKTFLLYDTSASMGQRDRFEADEQKALEAVTGLDLGTQPSRNELAVAAIRRQGVVPELEKKNRVEIYTFDRDVQPLSQFGGTNDVPATGDETRLGDALRSVLDDVGRDPLAGIIVVSDGRVNGGRPLDEVAEQLAVTNQAPIHAVGVGRAQLVKNYAVEEFRAPKVVEVGFPLQLESKVVLSGIRGAAKVTLERSTLDGQHRTVVEERQLHREGLHFEARLRFIDKLPRKGVFRYTLKVSRNAEEIRHDDNENSVVVRGAEEEKRVLLLGGNATYEFQYLRNFADRDDGILFSSWLTNADRDFPQDGDVPIQVLPETAQDLAEYDVVILVDPDARSLTPIFLDGLTDFVAEQGGGLVYVASEVNTPSIALDRRFLTLRILLPVHLGSTRQESDGPYVEPWRPRLTPQGQEHPICRLVDDPRTNRRLWARLPPFYYLHAGAKLRPAAVALADSRRGSVVVAVQRVGFGQTVYLGSDDFYRWREVEGCHERFWAGILRHLATGKYDAGTRHVTLETDRDLYRQGETVRVTVQMVDAKRRPVELARVDVAIRHTEMGEKAVKNERPREWAVRLAPDGARAGQYSGLFRPPFRGHYSVTVGSQAEARFDVVPQAREWEDPSPDFVALETLALESGGSFTTLEGLDSVAAKIPQTSVTEVLGRRAVAVWDSSALMILFCCILSVEWVLRKIWRLS